MVNPNDVLSLGAIYRYRMASCFSVNETMSFEALSNACGLNEVDTSRLVRHAMSNHIFQEQDGKVAHTAASRILAENTMIRDIMGVMCEEVFPGAAHVLSCPSPSVRQWRKSEGLTGEYEFLDCRCLAAVRPGAEP